jgi:hypothetical protein
MDAVILSHSSGIDFLRVCKIELKPYYFLPNFIDEDDYPGDGIKPNQPAVSILSSLNYLTFDGGTDFDEIYHVPKINGKKEGFYLSKYVFGGRHREGFYKDNEYDGTWKSYSERGDLRSQCRCSNGNDILKSYDSSGELISQETIIDGYEEGYSVFRACREGHSDSKPYEDGYLLCRDCISRKEEKVSIHKIPEERMLVYENQRKTLIEQRYINATLIYEKKFEIDFDGNPIITENFYETSS